jgi:hypothetical protein
MIASAAAETRFAATVAGGGGFRRAIIRFRPAPLGG